jgi:hypothetical protein
VPDLPSGADTSTFRWVFDMPDEESLTVVPGGGVSTDVPPLSQSPLFAEPSFSGADVSTPSLDGPTGAKAAPAPALDPQDVGPSVPRLEAELASTTSNTARVLGLIMLLASALWAGWAYLGPNGADVAVAGGEGRAGGLGRFARPRAEPPVPIT